MKKLSKCKANSECEVASGLALALIEKKNLAIDEQLPKHTVLLSERNAHVNMHPAKVLTPSTT
jgi:hypothetical protein